MKSLLACILLLGSSSAKPTYDDVVRSLVPTVKAQQEQIDQLTAEVNEQRLEIIQLAEAVSDLQGNQESGNTGERREYNQDTGEYTCPDRVQGVCPN